MEAMFSARNLFHTGKQGRYFSSKQAVHDIEHIEYSFSLTLGSAGILFTKSSNPHPLPHESNGPALIKLNSLHTIQYNTIQYNTIQYSTVFTIHTSYQPSARSVRQVMDRVFSFLLWPKREARGGHENKEGKNEDP